MRVLLNATSARLGGGITVVRNLLPSLLSEDESRNEYVVVAHAEVLKAIDPSSRRVRFVTSNADSFIARVGWEQLQVPMRLLRDRFDVVLSLGGLAVFAAPAPQVVMYQNLAPFDAAVVARAPTLKRARFHALRHLGIASASVARKVVFISDFARRVITSQLPHPVAAERVYLGRDPAFRPHVVSSPSRLARLGLPPRYLLSVSQFYFYKNFVELVDAFAAVRSQIPPDIVLAIAGAEHETGYANEVRARIAAHGIGDSVRLLGAIAYEELPELYGGALAVLFPSTVENFPNILVEGLACGAPTFSSNLGPMPEIAGDGAHYFDPHDRADIGRSIVAACNEPALRAVLSERGVARARRFSWTSTARELLRVLETAR